MEARIWGVVRGQAGGRTGEAAIWGGGSHRSRIYLTAGGGYGQCAVSEEGMTESGTKRGSWRGQQGHEPGSPSLAGGLLKSFNWVRFLEYHLQVDVIIGIVGVQEGGAGRPTRRLWSEG